MLADMLDDALSFSQGQVKALNSCSQKFNINSFSEFSTKLSTTLANGRRNPNSIGDGQAVVRLLRLRYLVLHDGTHSNSPVLDIVSAKNALNSER
jgi:hypothetical protein